MYMFTAVQRFDTKLTKQIQSLGPQWLRFFQQMTLIGQPVFGIGIAAAISFYGEYVQNWQMMFTGMIVATSLLLSSAFKFVLRRKRPATVYAKNMFIKTYSFPSGHAAASASCFALGTYLLIISGNLFLTMLGFISIPLLIAIGVSRVYLGAHYPTDIIGGWILGGIGLAVAVSVLHLQ